MDIPDIQHQPDRHRFVLPIDGEEATLLYAHRGPVLDLYHVFVPTSQRGKGLAQRLTRAALDHARQQQAKVRATCPYVAQYIAARHDEYADLLAP